jgi:hypothetical protein
VDSGDLHIFDGSSAIALLVLDAHVGKLDVVVHHGQLVRLRPALDFFLSTIGPSIAVATPAILGLQEALVLTLQLVVEDQTTRCTRASRVSSRSAARR